MLSSFPFGSPSQEMSEEEYLAQLPPEEAAALPAAPVADADDQVIGFTRKCSSDLP